MSKQTFTLLGLFLIAGVSCHQNQTDNSPTEREDFGLLYLSMFGGIIIVASIRHLVRTFDVPVPYSVFCVMFGIIWGTGALYNHWMSQMNEMSNYMVNNIQYIYLPILVFSIVFCIDVHAFTKSLPQILIIGGPVAVLSAAITGSLMRQVIDPVNWTVTDSVIFGTLLIAIYPMDALRCLRDTTIQTKHVKILLEGETIITASISCTIFDFTVTYLSGWIIHWYQFVMHLIKQVVLGVPLSYMYGLFGCFLMKLAFNDAVGLMLITISMCYNAYFVLHRVANCGVLGTIIVGMMMGSKRTSLSKEMEKTVTTLWKFISCIMNGMLFLFIGNYVPKLLLEKVQFKEYSLVLATYLITNIARFIAYLVFSPILSRIGYGMSFQNMIFCVWVGMKNPICMDMSLYLFQVTYSNAAGKARLFFMHTVVIYMLTLFINGTTVRLLIKALGLSELSFARQINMNNCIKYIYEARARTAAILKMDRFLSDANWPLVMETTALKHPYMKKNQDEIQKAREESEEAYFLTYKFTYCPDCQKDIPNQPTPKEMKEMTKEAKLRILKLRKTAYSRLYENGMMSKEAIRILHQSVEVATDSEELVIELDGLFKMFAKQGIFFIFLRNLFQFCVKNSTKIVQPPRKMGRRRCYRLMFTERNSYLIFMIVVVSLNLVLFIYHILRKQYFEYNYKIIGTDFFFINCSFLFFLVYLIEFVLKVFALSWIYVCKHGVRNYFRFIWHIVEFVILCFQAVCIIVHFTHLIMLNRGQILMFIDFFFAMLLLVRLMGLVGSVLQNFGTWRTLTPSIIKYLESEIDKHRALAFEVGKNYIAVEEEILENLHQIVDNEQIREVIKEKIESDKLMLTKRLGIAEKESPIVATTVKTKLAINTILNIMKEDAHDLKVAGWVDDSEYRQLLNSLVERYKHTNSIKSVQPVPSKLIFREIAWMGEDDELIDFLYNNSQTKRFEPSEVVMKEGDLAEAIYILISGIMVTRYVPSDYVLHNLLENGIPPIADFIFSIDYTEAKHDYIVPGNSVGESSILNKRGCDSSLIAETECQVYTLRKSVLMQAFEMNSDPVRGLECRMWKAVYFRQAMIIMINTPAYRSFTHDKIRFILERSFMPNLTNYKVFVVNEMMADILLIIGVAVDLNTRDVYTAPCYIPRAVQKLVLPKSSCIDLECPVETKLLIIPAKDYDEYEIMVTEEQMGELVNEDSTKCLRHLVQSKGLDTSGTKATKHMTEIMTALRKKMMGLENFRHKRFKVAPESKPSTGKPSRQESTITSRPSSQDSKTSTGKASNNAFS